MAMPNLLELVNFLLQANVWWGIINLFPVYPLDGGQISRELLLMRSPANGIRLSLQLSIFTAVILAVGAILQKHGMYMAVMFGFLAYSSYQNLKAYNDFGRYRGSDW
jgi:Zn-dependent protease